jgi:hypothetical protein
MLWERLLHPIRSGRVRVDPLVVDAPPEEGPDDGEVRTVRVGRGRREVVLVVVNALAEVLGVPAAVDDFDVVEVRDAPMVLQELRERVEDDTVVRPVVAGVETAPVSSR